jgi:hypothetical protein
VKTITRWIVVLFLLPLPAMAQNPPAPFQRIEEKAPCRDYDPLRKPLFGETHSHTAYSLDAVSLGTVDTPREAYRYAQGPRSTSLVPYRADAAPGPGGRPARRVH